MRIFFALSFLVFSAASSVITPANSKTFDAKFIGSWSGCLVSGGLKIPAVTHIRRSGDKLSGDYLFLEDSGKLVFGKLLFSGHPKGNQLNMRWSDKYGTGTLSMKFNAKQFIGRWKDDASGQWQGSWDGERAKGIISPKPDCSPLIG